MALRFSINNLKEFLFLKIFNVIIFLINIPNALIFRDFNFILYDLTFSSSNKSKYMCEISSYEPSRVQGL